MNRNDIFFNNLRSKIGLEGLEDFKNSELNEFLSTLAEKDVDLFFLSDLIRFVKEEKKDILNQFKDIDSDDDSIYYVELVLLRYILSKLKPDLFSDFKIILSVIGKASIQSILEDEKWEFTKKITIEIDFILLKL